MAEGYSNGDFASRLQKVDFICSLAYHASATPDAYEQLGPEGVKRGIFLALPGKAAFRSESCFGARGPPTQRRAQSRSRGYLSICRRLAGAGDPVFCRRRQSFTAKLGDTLKWLAGRLPARAARANEIDNALAQVQRVALPHDPPPNMAYHSSPTACQLGGAAFGDPGCG
jgi:hypothetical protein